MSSPASAGLGAGQGNTVGMGEGIVTPDPQRLERTQRMRKTELAESGGADPGMAPNVVE